MKRANQIAQARRPYPEALEGYREAKPYLLAIALTFVILFLPQLADAQCAMCRAVTESNLKTDDAFTVGNGLNNAIVYLMFMPYILAAIFGYAFFREPIKKWFKKKLA